MAPKEKSQSQLSSYKFEAGELRFTDTPFRQVCFSRKFSDHIDIVLNNSRNFIGMAAAMAASKKIDTKQIDLYIDMDSENIQIYTANLIFPDAFSISFRRSDEPGQFAKDIEEEIEAEHTRKAPPIDAEVVQRQSGDSTHVRGPYRKASELPDPSKPAGAEINRTKRQVKLRLSPEVISEIDEAAVSDGTTRNDWMEAALKKALKRTP